MKNIQCTQCGGTLEHSHGDIWKCKYCETQYQIDETGMIPTVRVISPGYRVLKCMMSVADEMKECMPEERLEKYIKETFASGFANELLQHFDEIFNTSVEYDPASMRTNYKAMFRYVNKFDEGGNDYGNTRTF